MSESDCYHEKLEGLFVVVVLHDAAGVYSREGVRGELHEAVRVTSVVEIVTNAPNKQG